MSNELEPIQHLDNKIKDIASQIINEDNVDKTKDLVALFNWNISKKNVTRIQKLNNLYDAVTDQMTTRFETKADQFSNSDLLDYVKVLQGAIDATTKNMHITEEPPASIIQNNTQINVNVADTFDSDAKARILAAVQATLQQATKPADDNIVIQTEEGN